MDLGGFPCLPSSFHRSPSLLIFLRNPSEKNFWWSKGIQLAGYEGNKPMSSRWPLSFGWNLMRSILGTHVCYLWGDHGCVSCFSSESCSSFFLFFFFFNLFNDNSGLWWGFNPAFSSLFSPWSFFKRSLICLKSDSRVLATFLPGVLRAPKPSPFAQGTCFSAHFLLPLRE